MSFAGKLGPVEQREVAVVAFPKVSASRAAQRIAVVGPSTTQELAPRRSGAVVWQMDCASHHLEAQKVIAALGSHISPPGAEERGDVDKVLRDWSPNRAVPAHVCLAC